MAIDDLFLRRAVAFGSALVYWAGVLVQARRVGRHIGRSPNVRPQGARETLLWAGWLIVIVAWTVQPFLTASGTQFPWLRIIPSLVGLPGLGLGILMTVAGYAGTLWCYTAMGDTWRIGIDQMEKSTLVTRGPYHRVRHPIYLFQIVMLLGVVLLLPTPLFLIICLVHLLCVIVKASDEEKYLLTVHGHAYRDYMARSGMLFPRLSGRASPSR